MRLRVVANLAVCAATVLCLFSCREAPLAHLGPLPRKDQSALIPTVVSLSPSTTDVMLNLGVALAGRCKADTEVGMERVPIVCDVKPDYEKIASLNPDVILFDPDLFSKADIEKFSTLKTSVVAVGGHTIKEFITSLYALGRCTSTETNVEDYVDRIYRDMQVSQTNPIVPKPTAAMILVNPSGNPMIAGKNSFYADLMRVGGAEPVGPDGDKFESISVEALVALNPTILVVPAPVAKVKDPKFSPLAADPRLAALPAAKKNHVFAMDEVVAERPGGRVDMAIREMHSGFDQVLAR